MDQDPYFRVCPFWSLFQVPKVFPPSGRTLLRTCLHERAHLHGGQKGSFYPLLEPPQTALVTTLHYTMESLTVDHGICTHGMQVHAHAIRCV